jgi:hypothetical protein
MPPHADPQNADRAGGGFALVREGRAVADVARELGIADSCPRRCSSHSHSAHVPVRLCARAGLVESRVVAIDGMLGRDRMSVCIPTQPEGKPRRIT